MEMIADLIKWTKSSKKIIVLSIVVVTSLCRVEFIFHWGEQQLEVSKYVRSILKIYNSQMGKTS